MSNQNSSKKIGLNSIISFGASVVILGLMFKILHWKGAEWMIGLGLMTEAVLFAILGWASRVSPEEEAAANGGNNLSEVLNSAVTPKVVEGLTKGFEQFTKTVQSVNSIARLEEHTSELQSHHDLVCRLLLEKKKPAETQSAAGIPDTRAEQATPWHKHAKAPPRRERTRAR